MCVCVCVCVLALFLNPARISVKKHGRSGILSRRIVAIIKEGFVTHGGKGISFSPFWQIILQLSLSASKQLNEKR